MLLDLFVYLMLLGVMHFNVTTMAASYFVRHFVILLNHLLIGRLRLGYLLPRSAVLIMLHDCFLIEFDVISRALRTTLLEDASSRCSRFVIRLSTRRWLCV